MNISPLWSCGLCRLDRTCHCKRVAEACLDPLARAALMHAADRSCRDPCAGGHRDAALRQQLQQEADRADGTVEHGLGGRTPDFDTVDIDAHRPAFEAA